MIASRTPEKQQYGGADPTETKSRGAHVIELPAATTVNTHHTAKIASRGSGGLPSEQHQGLVGRALPPPPTNSPLLLQDHNPKQVKLLENILQKHSLELSPPTSLQHQHSPQRRLLTASPSQQVAAVPASSGDGKIDGHLDVKLQLLDSQLRHILKSSREDSLVSSSGSAKADHKGAPPRDAAKLQKKSSLSSVHQPPQPLLDDRYSDRTRVIESGIGEKGDGVLADKGEKYSEKQRERGSVGDTGKRVSIELKTGTGAGGDEDDEVLVVAIEGNGHHPDPADDSDDGDGSNMGVPVTRKPSIINLLSAYRGADDRSQTNHADDVLTNVYMDDMATRAAPYTVVSQMNMSLGDSDDGAASDPEDHSCRTLNRAHSLTSLSFSPFSEKRRGSHLMRQILDVSEKLGMREFWKRRDIYNELNRSSSTDCSQGRDDVKSATPKLPVTAGASEAVSEHKPVLSILREMPKPKFSTKSPSSPAKLSSLSKQSQSPDTSRSLKPSGVPVTMTTVVPMNTTALSDSHAAGDSVIKDSVHVYKAPFSAELVKPGDVSDNLAVDKQHIGGTVDVNNILCAEPVASAAICVSVTLKPFVQQEAEPSNSDTEVRHNKTRPCEDVDHRLHEAVDTSQKVVFSLEERGMADGASPRLVDSETADRPPSAAAEWNHSLKDPDLAPTTPEIPPIITAESVSPPKKTPPFVMSEKNLVAMVKTTTKSSTSLLDIFETRNVDPKCNIGSSNGTVKKNNFGVLNGTTENSEMSSEPSAKHVAPSADDKHESEGCDFGVAKLTDLECDNQSKKELSRVLHDIFGSDSMPAKTHQSSSFQKNIHAFNNSLSQPVSPGGKFASLDHDSFHAQRQHSLGRGLVSFTDDLSQTRSVDLPVSDEHLGGQGSRTPNTDTGRQPRPPPGHAPRSAMASTAVR